MGQTLIFEIEPNLKAKILFPTQTELYKNSNIDAGTQLLIV